MLTFFRRIRKGLLDGGRTSKYLLYAIGEILLVMIGILLALQVNNWNQERADHGLELEYAKRLKLDLEQDILRFIQFETVSLAIKRDVLKALYLAQDVESILHNSFVTAENLEISIYQALPEAQASTYEESKNTGNFRLMRNPDIRLQLDDHYDLHELLAGILQQSPGSYIQILHGSIPGIAAHESQVKRRDYSVNEKRIGFTAFLNHPGKQEALNLELFYTSQLSHNLNLIKTTAEKNLANLELEYPVK